MLIKIIQVPSGMAPQIVREQWVGAIMAAFPMPGWASATHVDGETPADYRNGFCVDRDHAISILEAISPAAADWFRENLAPWSTELVFQGREVEIIINEGNG